MRVRLSAVWFSFTNWFHFVSLRAFHSPFYKAYPRSSKQTEGVSHFSPWECVLFLSEMEKRGPCRGDDESPESHVDVFSMCAPLKKRLCLCPPPAFIQRLLVWHVGTERTPGRHEGRKETDRAIMRFIVREKRTVWWCRAIDTGYVSSHQKTVFLHYYIFICMCRWK